MFSFALQKCSASLFGSPNMLGSECFILLIMFFCSRIFLLICLWILSISFFNELLYFHLILWIWFPQVFDPVQAAALRSSSASLSFWALLGSLWATTPPSPHMWATHSCFIACPEIFVLKYFRWTIEATQAITPLSLVFAVPAGFLCRLFSDLD